MLHYNNLENLKLYKSNRLFLPLDESSKKKTFNSLIYLNTSSLDSSLNIMNSKMFFNKLYFKSYFVDYIYRFKLFNKQVIKKIDTKDYYLRAVKETKFITKTYKFPKNYKERNLYVDLSMYNTLFKEKIGFRKGNIVIKEYLKMLNEINTKFNYNKRVMIFDMQDWKFDTKDTKNYKYSAATEPIQILYASMYRFPEEFKKLNFDILLVNKNFFVKLTPSKCDEKSFQKLRTQLNKMRVKNTFELIEPQDDNTKEEPSDINDKKEKKESAKVIVKDELERDILKKININDKTDEYLDIQKFNFTGDVDLSEDEEPEGKIETKIKKEVEKISSELPDEDLDDEDLERLKIELKEKLNEDEEFLKELELIKAEKIANISANNIKRNKLLEEKQAKVKINGKGKSIDDIITEIQEKTIEPKEVKIDTMNENIKKMKLVNFENEYNKKLFDKDTVAIINFFKSLSAPVYILDIKKEDTSDQFNKKFTYTVKMESSDRERHNVKFDIPKFVEDKFLYLNGNKKNIIHQLVLKPISKTGPNTVQICTNYNKAFISRSGTKVSPKIERMKKALVQFKSKNLKTKVGNNLKSNIKYKTTMEYDEIGANYMNVDINNEIFLYFNQDQIREYLKKNDMKYTKNDNIIPIGYVIKNGKKEVLELDTDKDKILKYNKSVCDFITDEISKKVPDFKNQMNKLTVGKKFICTKVKIMRKDVPLLLLLAYLEGLSTIMQKAEINFTFSDTRPILKDDKNDKDIIEFKDGYLVYNRYPMRNSLLMNSLSLIPTKEYDFEDFDERETYLEIFENLLGMRMIANAFNNFYDLLIDPISKEVLQDLNLPTDFAGVMLYANALLEDNIYTRENDLSLYRLRSNEVVNSYLYKSLADSYSKYRGTATNKNPVKMSIPQNEVIKNILMSPIIEDYSTLNPILEAEKTRAVTCKGPNGMNQERAFTIDKRAYDKSMKGILAMSSPPTSNVGVVRQLSLDAELLSPRGYMKTNSTEDELNSVNLFSPAELLTPMCATKDDSPRVAMTSIQSKHIIPCKKYDKLLMGDGTEKALSKIISDDFAFKAKEDGTIKEVHDDLDFFVVEYKNGETDIIETGNKISKNGGGGFYINNKLKTNFKEGEKFKKDDILAYNNNFFNQSSNKSDAVLQVGTLAKVAIMSGYFNYEDSGIITQKLCEEMSTNVIMKKDVSLGKNSNIEYIVSKGQQVEVGDPLLIFDESYDDEGLNKMLAGMGSVGEEIQNLGKVPIRSKYSGTIEDIKIYSTVEINELSPSLQKLVKQINEPLVKAEKIIKKYKEAKDLVLTIAPTNKKIETPDGKIKGIEVNDGVLIEFYINYNDKMGVGDLDKVSLYSNIQRTIFLIAGNSLEL